MRINYNITMTQGERGGILCAYQVVHPKIMSSVLGYKDGDHCDVYEPKYY